MESSQLTLKSKQVKSSQQQLKHDPHNPFNQSVEDEFIGCFRLNFCISNGSGGFFSSDYQVVQRGSETDNCSLQKTKRQTGLKSRNCLYSDVL